MSSPASSHLPEATTLKFPAQRGVALQAPARSVTAGHPQHLPEATSAKLPPQLLSFFVKNRAS